MVKDVVKSECRMIDMWSCFQVVEALKNRSAGREEMQSEKRRKIDKAEKNTPNAICGQPSEKR